MSELKERWKELTESFTEKEFVEIDALEEKLKEDAVVSKIIRVIQSCTTHDHLLGALKMISLYFNKKWENETNKVFTKFILTRHSMKKAAELNIVEAIDL
jgi:type II secretory pathway predicted ATPase ExeA